MKNVFISLLLFTFGLSEAQNRGARLAYIDMEYILKSVPDYVEAKNQIDKKALQWKGEIDTKKNEIKLLKDALNTERVLLTKDLIEEREEEIEYLEKELLDYQQKRFGPNGDFVMQKAVLVKPIQDQVFEAIQGIAERQKYDFVLDKSSDLTLIFASKRFDLSDRVIRELTRAGKREQLSRKQLKELEEKERQEDLMDENPELADRKKAQDEKIAQREKMIEDRKLAAEKRKQEYEEKRQRLIDERNAKKNGTVSAKQDEKPAGNKKVGTGTTQTEGDADEKEDETPKGDEKKPDNAKPGSDAKPKPKTLEERKQELEEKKKKVLAEREAAKKERENNQKQKENN